MKNAWLDTHQEAKDFKFTDFWPNSQHQIFKT